MGLTRDGIQILSQSRLLRWDGTQTVSCSSLSDLESVPEPLGRFLELSLLYASSSLKPRLFCVPKDRGVCSQCLSTVSPSPLLFTVLGWGFSLLLCLCLSSCSLAILSILACSGAVHSALSASPGRIVLLIGVIWCVPRRR